MESLVLGIASFIFGILLVVFLLWYSKLRLKQVAHNEANDLISAAEDAANDLLEEAKRRAEDYSSELQSEWEKEKERIEEKNEKYLADAEEVREQLETKQRSLQKNYDRKLNAVKKYDKVVDQFQTEFKKLRDRKRELNKEYIQKLSKISAINTQDILAELQRQILNEATTNATKFIQNSEQEAQEHSERIAKKVLNIAIFRFARAYCPERGIGYFVFKNEKEKHHILGANYEFAKIIEDVCGVDLVYNENANSLSISGFDPVRRELARASVERLMKDRYINEKRIREIVQKTKKELFRKISQDGQRIANELKLKKLKLLKS